MDLITTNTLPENSNNDIETVVDQKQEYKLVGKFRRTRGLKMFAWNAVADELYEVDIKINNTVSITPDPEGNLVTADDGTEEVNVNTSHTHFEALNMKTAMRRLAKYKLGLIELFNLKPYNPEGIKLY